MSIQFLVRRITQQEPQTNVHPLNNLFQHFLTKNLLNLVKIQLKWQLLKRYKKSFKWLNRMQRMNSRLSKVFLWVHYLCLNDGYSRSNMRISWNALEECGTNSRAQLL